MNSNNQDAGGNTVQEMLLSHKGYLQSFLIAQNTGAQWGRCYVNAYPVFFAFQPLFEADGHLVEGWIVFEYEGTVVLMEHGWLVGLVGGTSTIIDPTIVLLVEPDQPVSYYPGVLRDRIELEQLENELFPHVHYADYGDDGMLHPAYRTAYEAALLKAQSLMTEGKTFVEVRARMLTAEEEAARQSETALALLFVVVPDHQKEEQNG